MKPSPVASARSSGGGVADPYDVDRRRLRRLIWVLGGLLAVFITPLIIGRIKYEYTYNDQLAKMQVAKEQLGELELEGLSHASRLIAAGVGPSVVHIRSTQLVLAPPNDELRSLPWVDPDPDEFERQGDGSGVIVDDNGYIVTNHHVVAGAESLKVVLNDGREAFADVIGSDVVSDVAVIKIDLDNLHAAEWGDSDELDIGDLVWAMGSPFGLRQSTTFGIISAKDRTEVSHALQHFLQTDAAVNPGNSGGPLIGTNGKIVGINTAIVGRSFRGVSFAIPSNTARKMYESIREDGEVARGWLGVYMEEVSPRLAEQFQVSTEGAMIRSVFEGSPANVARLQPGDVIIRWGGREVADPTELTHMVVETPIGADVEVVYVRGGRERTTTVHVGKRPALAESNR